MKLHIGGEIAKEGWKILNIANKPDVDIIGDITSLEQFEDDSFYEIYASHVLEHIPEAKILATLINIKRILKKEGKFYISVPDLDILCHSFINPILSPEVKYHILKMIFGGQSNDNDFHYFGWNQLFLFNALRQAGYSDASRVESFGIFNDTSDYKPYGYSISLNVIATK